MIDEQQFLDLCSDIESDRVERTISTTNTDKFCEAVCAFANDLSNHREPGYLLIGVQDDGTLSGLQVTDQLLQNLAAIRSDGNVLPQPALAVGKFSFADGDAAVVEVMPSDLPPVRYKGRVYVRVGPRRAIANEQEERLLSERRVARARSFDTTPCLQSSLDDLILGQFAAYRRAAIDADTIAANNRSVEEQLAALRFFDPQSGCPTHAGILLFGTRPRFWLPGAYIQYLRFLGAEMSEVPADQAEISGDLQSVLLEVDARIRAGIQTALRTITGSLREEQVHDYPVQAIREIVMNAIMHRNYESNTPVKLAWFSDHIEVLNPGGLYGEATPENFPTRSSYRNPVIAEAMKELGYVNRYGYGVQRAQLLLRENGNPPLEYEFDLHSVRMIIHRKPC